MEEKEFNLEEYFVDRGHEHVKDLEQQLQAYKDREDKVIKWVYANCDGTYDGTLEHAHFTYDTKPIELEQILNKEVNKN